jgi:Zn-finger domain-containing protein
MAKLTKRLNENFASQLVSIESTRSRMEGLLVSGQISNSDISHVYAGLFMELFTDFEALLEELFFGLLDGNLYTRTYPISKIAKISPTSQIKNIVHGGKAYVNWLPYKEHTLPRAKLYINAGEPFCRLTNPDINIITNL